MKKIIKTLIITGLSIFLMIFCIIFVNAYKTVKTIMKGTETSLRAIRENPFLGMTDEEKMDRSFYNSIKHYSYSLEGVINCLSEGRSPDYCYGECGWIDSNPLLLLSELHYDTYIRNKHGEEIPKTTPDIELFNLLIDAGADINKYPYVFAIVYRKNNDSYMDENEKIIYVSDSNRILKAFLDKQADPNAKGNYKTFDWQTNDENMSYEEFQEMCNSPEATTPLYEAIKKGIKWESQVDLLLEYGAILDESCLEAAKLSGDEQMIEKVQKLWEDKK